MTQDTGLQGRVQPTPRQLGDHALRILAGAALVLLAAGVVHAFGLFDQRWPYVAMALALLPQVLIDLLAARRPERRRRVRLSRRPWPVPALAAGALLLAAAWSLSVGAAWPSVVAALCACAGLALASAPTSVVLVPRRG